MRPWAQLFVFVLVSIKAAAEKDVVQLQIEVEAPDAWSLSVGDSVEIRCFPNKDSDLEETKRLNLTLLQRTASSVRTLAAQSVSRSVSFTLQPVALEHRGLYSCEGDSDQTHVTVEAAHRLVWVHEKSAPVSLKLLRVQRVKYFYGKALTVGCELPQDDSDWKIMSASEKTGRISECPNQDRSGDLLSCTVAPRRSVSTSYEKLDPLWCQSSAGKQSDVLNMTRAEMLESRGRVEVGMFLELLSPWFVAEGDSVDFRCNVTHDIYNHKSNFELQLLRTNMGPGNNITVVKSQKASKPLRYTLNNITHEHSGVYSCWDDGTLSNIFTFPYPHYLIWVQDEAPPVTIDVLSHNRTQFFHYEAMTVGCQLPDDQSQWKIKIFDKFTGLIRECDEAELSPSRLLSCTMNMGYPWTNYHFWCESLTGQRSNVLNISNTIAFDVLEAPSLPVMEGDDLTLRCLQKTKVGIAPAPAFFWINPQKIIWSDDGSVTLKNVTKENEGFYKCRLKDLVTTLNSFVVVKARPQEQQTKTD